MTPGRRPRIGFVGLGWIAGLRLEGLAPGDGAVAEAPSDVPGRAMERTKEGTTSGATAGAMVGGATGATTGGAVTGATTGGAADRTGRRGAVAEVAALCEPDPERLAAVGADWPDAWRCASLEALLRDGPELDGVVISTPNALHGRQALAVMERGVAPFVQKPLGIEAGEVAAVLADAERRDLHLGVDLSYRGLEAARRLRSTIADGRLGEVFLVEGAFHNAYGPDKAWCFDPDLSGGGALLDLGVHLVDLAFWCCGARDWTDAGGWRLDVPGHPGIDGFAEVEGIMAHGPRFRVGASWNAHAGRDCDLRLTFHGTDASAEIRNLDGSFFDFELLLRSGRAEERVVLDRRRWMDRPLLDWVEGLGRGDGFDRGTRSNLAVARLLERVYARDPSASEAESGVRSGERSRVRPAASAISSAAR